MYQFRSAIVSAATLLLVLLTAFAAPRSVQADPLDSTLFYLPCVTGEPGDSHIVSLGINTVHDIGGFRCNFNFAPGALTSNGISFEGTRSEGVPIYTGVAQATASGDLVVVVIYEPSEYVPAGNGLMARLILPSDPSLPAGSLLPLSFPPDFESWPPEPANELADPGGLNVFYPDFNHGSIRLRFDSVSAQLQRGDANLNGVSYEPGDLALMHFQLRHGIDTYIDRELQTVLSDVNCDHLAWTIADLLTVKDVLGGSSPPSLSGTPNPFRHLPGDSIWFTGGTVDPADTFEIPIYMSNSDSAGGISFKLEYSTEDLVFVSYSADGARLPSDWEMISATQREDGLMFYAIPDSSGGSSPYPMPPGAGLLVTLSFVAANPVSMEVGFRFERLQSYGQTNGYAVSTTNHWEFASLQQIDAVISMSYLFGDCNGSGGIDIDDVVLLVMYLFAGGPAPQPLNSGDFDRNQAVELNDAIELTDFIFRQ